MSEVARIVAVGIANTTFVDVKIEDSVMLDALPANHSSVPQTPDARVKQIKRPLPSCLKSPRAVFESKEGLSPSPPTSALSDGNFNNLTTPRSINRFSARDVEALKATIEGNKAESASLKQSLREIDEQHRGHIKNVTEELHNAYSRKHAEKVASLKEKYLERALSAENTVTTLQEEIARLQGDLRQSRKDVSRMVEQVEEYMRCN